MMSLELSDLDTWLNCGQMCCPGSTAGGQPGATRAERNEAGDMLLEAVKPPQPVSKKEKDRQYLSRRTFQFNLTEAEYSLPSVHSNPKFAVNRAKSQQNTAGVQILPAR